MRSTWAQSLTAALLVSSALAGPAAAQQETLQVWANKGFYKAEDDALLAVVDKFQKATGVKIELSLTSIEDCFTKSVGAVEAGTPPDVGYCLTYDFRSTGKWAFEGKLADLTDIVEPMKAQFVPEALATTLLFNDKAKKRAYYAVPVQRQTMHIQYWKDMLEEAGFKESDIPKDWDNYWNFWCDKVQAGLRAKGKRVFGIGQPLGVASTDTFFSFLMVAAAYDAQIVDGEGKVVLDQPQNRANMVKALKNYTDIHAKGCTPPSSVNWQDPDNNVAFHNKQIVMTHNATISIAAKWMDDMNNQSLTAEQRAEAKKNYEERIGTAGFPSRPDGKPVAYLAATKTAVVFEASKNQKRAKEFLAFLMKDENLRPFVEGSLGRWYPATTEATKSAFWQADGHRKSVHNQFTAGTVPFQFVSNFRFTQVNAENVWAKAMQRIIQDKIPVEQAVDEMIKRIKEVAGEPADGRGAVAPSAVFQSRPAMAIATATVEQETPARLPRRRRSDGRVFWGTLLLLPYALVFVAFVAYPVLYGLWLGRDPAIYRELFRDPAFFRAFTNTILFLLIAVNLKFLMALVLSGFFATQRRWIPVVLALFILPWAVPSIPTILSLRFMLNSEFGVINSELFRWFQIDGPGWLTNANLAFGAAIFTHIWKSLPFWTLILLTGRLAIPQEQYEAAQVDGASSWQQFRYITWPSIATLYLTSTLLSMIWTLGDFNSVYLLTGGGPGDQTHVLATLGIRYLRIDKLSLGIASIIVAMPIVLPMVFFMVRRLSKGPDE